jgi:PAS domain-containing protein
MADTFNAMTSMAPHESLQNQNGIDPSAIFSDHDVSPNSSNHGEDDEYVRPVSPLHMPPGQIDGLDALKSESHLQQRGQSPHRRDYATSSLLHQNIPRCLSPADIALSAMQYLPYLLIVLNGLKTLAMANKAMGRLLGIEEDDRDDLSNDGISEMEKLKGQTLSQLEIDMLQDGRPVWVTWEAFLDSLAEDIGSHPEDAARQHASEYGEGGMTPTAERTEPFHTRSNSDKSNSMVHDSVVEVVITQAGLAASSLARSDKAVTVKQTFAKMIITIWEIDDERFFTLSFTSTDSSQTSLPSSQGQSRQLLRASKQFSLGSISSGSGSSPSSVASGRSSNQGGSSSSSAITSPTNVSMSASPFPPLGPPSKSTVSNSPSTLQKVIVMKDALLDNTEVPILAMWKDESLTIPNKAARRLFHPKADLQNVKDGFDLVSKWHVWDETFTTRINPSEYPISVLVRTQTPFSSRKIGLYDPETDRKLLFDCLGEAMTDEETGEFLAGIVTCRDITSMTENMNEQINEIKEKGEQRFQLICDSMPQMIWTTLPDGRHNWFSQRWYVCACSFLIAAYNCQVRLHGTARRRITGTGLEIAIPPG